MPSIPFGFRNVQRAGNFPPFRLVNLFAETNPSAGIALLSRPGMAVSSTVGSGDIRALYKADGVFGGALLAVSGTEFYKGATYLGQVTGNLVPSIAGSSLEVLVAAGESLHQYDGTTYAAEVMPDNAEIAAVVFISGYFVAARADSQKYYWRLSGASTWDALDFASAESKPDQLADLGVVQGILWLFGSESAEPWQITGDADLPFLRIPNSTFDKGIFGRGCVTAFDNSLAFVGSDCVVYRIEGGPRRISDHDLEERLAASTVVSCFAYARHGHSYLCVRYDGGGLLDDGSLCAAGTAVYDAATQRWTEFASYGEANWLIRSATGNAEPFLGGDAGRIWQFSGYADGAQPIERLFTAAFPVPGGRVPVDTVTVEMNVGWKRPLTGQGSAPVLEVRSSQDAGATFGAWRSMSIGRLGEYPLRGRLTRFGSFGAPGAMFEFRLTDPIGLRVSDVKVNEAL